MQLYFLTAVGWSLDSSGNLQAINTAGTVQAKFVGGAFHATGNTASASSNPNYAVPGATIVSTGFGLNITPVISGRIYIQIAPLVQNSTAGILSMNLYIYYNTTGVPSQGTSVGSDTSVASAACETGPNGATQSFFQAATVSSLANGTKYYFYLAINGTANAGYGVGQTTGYAEEV